MSSNFNIALYDNIDSIYNQKFQSLFYINGHNVLGFTGKFIDKEFVFTVFNNIHSGLLYIYSGLQYFTSILYYYLMPIQDKFVSNIYKFALHYLYDDKFDHLIISLALTFCIALFCVEYINDFHKNNQKRDQEIKMLNAYVDNIEFNLRQIEIRMKHIVENNCTLADIVNVSIVANQKEIDSVERKLKKMDRAIKMYA